MSEPHNPQVHPTGSAVERAPTPSGVASLSFEDVEKIILALKERGVTLPCPRCGNDNFNVEGAYFAHPIQTSLKTVSLGGPNIPTAVTTCTRCGFVSEHALGRLGLLAPSPSATVEETRRG